MKEILKQEKITPKIYVYTTAMYQKKEWEGKKDGKGWLKIGYTERDVKDRIDEQKTALPEEPILLHTEIAVDEDNNFFRDSDVHSKLKKKGFRIIKRIIKGKNTDWAECTIEDVEIVLKELKKGIEIKGKAVNDYKLRPEQQKAIEITKKYFEKNKKEKKVHFLWNAKMRFGKNFTAYKLAQEMNWKKILVLTYIPAVQESWRVDLETHMDFKNWKFIGKNEKYKSEYDKNPLVWFISFQDIRGRTKEGGIKERLEAVHLIDWDCVFLDEYHWGAWNDDSKNVYAEEGPSIDVQKDFKPEVIEDELPIKSKKYVYLSGTPFRAIKTGEFVEDQIFNWTYADEQKAKRENKEKNKKEYDPYASLPSIRIFTYELPLEIKKIAMKGEFNEFDLNEFFKAKEVIKDEKKVFEFEYKNYVQHFLDYIQGKFNPFIAENLGKPVVPPLPFEGVNFKLQHSFWYFSRVASCEAMENLLKEDQNTFFHNFKIIPAYGGKLGVGHKALGPVKEIIAKGHNTKTITLSCDSLTMGVTIPEWDSIFMLRDLESPEKYFQTAFRAQSPWTLKNQQNQNIEEIMKPECFIFDFSPNRVLKLITDYAISLDPLSKKTPKEKVAEMINFLPIYCFNGMEMQELEAAEILEYVSLGMTGPQLARSFEDPRLYNVDDYTLERLFKNKDVLNELEKIESFRDVTTDIFKIITTNKLIKKVKRKAKPLTKEEKKEEKNNTSRRNAFKKKLKSIGLKIPIFMYLTDFREDTLIHVIQNLEPDLFHKVTGISIPIFNKMVEIGCFPDGSWSNKVHNFRLYEEDSLNYAGGKKLSKFIGDFASGKLSRKELHEINK